MEWYCEPSGRAAMPQRTPYRRCVLKVNADELFEFIRDKLAVFPREPAGNKRLLSVHCDPESSSVCFVVEGDSIQESSPRQCLPVFGAVLAKEVATNGSPVR